MTQHRLETASVDKWPVLCVVLAATSNCIIKLQQWRTFRFSICCFRNVQSGNRLSSGISYIVSEACSHKTFDVTLQLLSHSDFKPEDFQTKILNYSPSI